MSQWLSSSFLVVVLVVQTTSIPISLKKFANKFGDNSFGVDENQVYFEKELGLENGMELGETSRKLKQVTSVEGGFGPSTTSSGCKCLTPWYALGDKIDGTCDNPAMDRLGVFCYVNETTCVQTPYSTRAQLSQAGVYDYCNPSTGQTVSGCECEHSWGFGGDQFLGTCSDPGKENNFWCYVNEQTCDNPPRGQLTGLKWDFCADPAEQASTKTTVSTTNAGCKCVDQWSYDTQQFYNGTCANPDGDLGGDWCYVDGRTCERTPYQKASRGDWDYCTPSADTTISGCKCRKRWDLFSTSFRSGFAGVCGNPDNDPKGSWCIVDSDTCNEPAYGAVGSQIGFEYDYCADVGEPMSEFMQDLVDDEHEDEDKTQVDTTINGCKCRPGASYIDMDDTFVFNGTCANPDLDAAGTWCIVDAKTCIMEPQGEFEIDSVIGVRDYWDYCEPPLAPPTLAGCMCEKRWSYPPGGMIDAEYFGVCANPDDDLNGNWCVVNAKSCTRGTPAGRLRPTDAILYLFGIIDTPYFDYCPPGAPTMDDFRALLPEDARLEAPSETMYTPPVQEQIRGVQPPSPFDASPMGVDVPFLPLPAEISPSPPTLLPPTPIPSPIPATVLTDEPADEGGCKTVVYRLADTQQLSSLFSAVVATGLTNILDDKVVQATMFAPTNDAFEAFYTQAGYASLEDFISAELDSLRNVLLYHIIANKRIEQSSLSGELITLFQQAPISVIGEASTGIQLVGGQGSTARVLLTDVVACNSIVHLIDTVLDVPLL